MNFFKTTLPPGGVLRAQTRKVWFLKQYLPFSINYSQFLHAHPPTPNVDVDITRKSMHEIGLFKNLSMSLCADATKDKIIPSHRNWCRKGFHGAKDYTLLLTLSSIPCPHKNVKTQIEWMKFLAFKSYRFLNFQIWNITSMSHSKKIRCL